MRRVEKYHYHHIGRVHVRDVVRYIGFYSNFLPEVEIDKDGDSCEGSLQGVEGSLGFECPSERYVLAYQFGKGEASSENPDMNQR
jgi:hypothetical protein